VDEAFVDLSHLAPENVHSFCLELKNKIEQWTGISVSIGAAPNKVLSKVANRLAKKINLKPIVSSCWIRLKKYKRHYNKRL